MEAAVPGLPLDVFDGGRHVVDIMSLYDRAWRPERQPAPVVLAHEPNRSPRGGVKAMHEPLSGERIQTTEAQIQRDQEMDDCPRGRGTAPTSLPSIPSRGETSRGLRTSVQSLLSVDHS
jgi:hypothetical protein